MAFSLKDDQRFQQRLMASASLAEATVKSLPDAELGPLDALTVTCTIPPITAEDVQEILATQLLEAAERTPREVGEEVEPGDEVRLTLIGYARGTIVPGVAREGEWLRVVDDGVFLGLAEELVGVPVGSTHTCLVQLGPKFPLSDLRGEAVTLGIKVHEARAVAIASADDDETWKRLGMESVESAAERAAEQLAQDREALKPLVGARAILTEVARGARVTVPASLIDAVLTRRWKEGEGESLTRAAIEVDEQNQSWKAWLALPALRQGAEEELRILCAAKALVGHFGLQVTDEAADELYREVAEADGKTVDQLKAELAADQRLFAEYEDVVIRKLLVQALLDRFPVTYVSETGPS